MKYEAKPVIVDAFEIIGVGTVQASGMAVRTEGKTHFATSEMIARFVPSTGDYWVIQEDGYEYLNPKDVFERKYRPVKHGYSAAADLTPPPPDGPGSSTGQ